jgi:hypothetical protein
MAKVVAAVVFVVHVVVGVGAAAVAAGADTATLELLYPPRAAARSSEPSPSDAMNARDHSLRGHIRRRPHDHGDHRRAEEEGKQAASHAA